MNKNTYFSFYITNCTQASIEKNVFETVLSGQPFENKRDAQEWISDNIQEIIDIVDTDLVFEHVVLLYKPTDTAVHPIKLIKCVIGKIVFADEVEFVPPPYFKNVENEADNKSDKPNKIRKTYPSVWIEPNGTEHKVSFANHNEFAHEWLLTTYGWSDEKIRKETGFGGYAYEILEKMGWIRILGWTDPPTFSFDESSKITPKQRKAIKDYCQENSCILPKKFDNI